MELFPGFYRLGGGLGWLYIRNQHVALHATLAIICYKFTGTCRKSSLAIQRHRRSLEIACKRKAFGLGKLMIGLEMRRASKGLIDMAKLSRRHSCDSALASKHIETPSSHACIVNGMCMFLHHTWVVKVICISPSLPVQIQQALHASMNVYQERKPYV